MEKSFTVIFNQVRHRPGIATCIMSKLLYLFILMFPLTGMNSCTCTQAPADSDNLILVCGDSKVLLADYSNSKDSIPKIVWTWDAHEATDLPDDYRRERFNSIDDCKAINNGSQIMVSSSSGAVAIVNREDKKVTFYAEIPNAHSIELLPGNKMIAAASTATNGNRIMLFDISKPDKLLYSDSLYSAHGLVWDSRRNSLYALGYDVLR